MKKYILKHKIGLILLVIGVITGYLYWYFVGCTSGTCLIKSKWYSMSLFGGIFGYLTGDSITDMLNKRKYKQNKLNTK